MIKKSSGTHHYGWIAPLLEPRCTLEIIKNRGIGTTSTTTELVHAHGTYRNNDSNNGFFRIHIDNPILPETTKKYSDNYSIFQVEVVTILMPLDWLLGSRGISRNIFELAGISVICVKYWMFGGSTLQTILLKKNFLLDLPHTILFSNHFNVMTYKQHFLTLIFNHQHNHQSTWLPNHLKSCCRATIAVTWPTNFNRNWYREDNKYRKFQET